MKTNVNSVEVHPSHSNNGPPVDGSLWPPLRGKVHVKHSDKVQAAASHQHLGEEARQTVRYKITLLLLEKGCITYGTCFGGKINWFGPHQKRVLKGELLIWRTKNQARDQGTVQLKRIQFASNQSKLDPGSSSKVGVRINTFVHVGTFCLSVTTSEFCFPHNVTIFFFFFFSENVLCAVCKSTFFFFFFWGC